MLPSSVFELPSGGDVAKIADIVVRRGRGGQQNGRWLDPVSSLEITFELPPDEAQLLPLSGRKMTAMFGPAEQYWSYVTRAGGTLIVRYSMRTCPIRGVPLSDIPLIALANLRVKLRKAAETRKARAKQH